MVNEEKPYITKRISRIVKLYNENYGDNRICECGHPYHRHFDPFEDENHQAVGCKYCCCHVFKEAQNASSAN